MPEVSTVQLNRIQSSINNLSQQQARLTSQVGDLGKAQAETRNDLALLAVMVSDFIDQNRREMALNLAETRVGNLLQEIESSFGHYETARNTATGLLQAFDTGLVTDQVVRSVSEELMIINPRYWLAPALVALAGWSRNERPLAEKALAECLKRDVNKTALFFMLVMRRYRREAAASRWLEQFLISQDPAALGREFVVVIEAVANGAFGPTVSDVLDKTIANWLKELAERPGFAEEQITRWRDEMKRLVRTQSADGFPTLSKWSPAWDRISQNLGMVNTHERIQRHFSGIFDGEVTVSPTLESRIDDLLDNLVTSFDVDELPLRRELVKQQAIIDANGDEKAASAKVGTTIQTLDEKVSFPTLLTNAAMHPKEAGVDRGTQRLAVALSRDWIVAAHDQFTAEARREVIVDVPLKHGTWTGNIRSGDDQAKLTSSITSHVDAETDAAVSKVRFRGAPLGAAIVGGALLIIGLATLTVAVIVIAVLGGAYAVYGWTQLDKKRAKLRDEGEKHKVTAIDGIKNCCAELVDLRRSWQGGDDYAQPLGETLRAMRPAEFNLAAPGSKATVIR